MNSEEVTNKTLGQILEHLEEIDSQLIRMADWADATDALGKTSTEAFDSVVKALGTIQTQLDTARAQRTADRDMIEALIRFVGQRGTIPYDQEKDSEGPTFGLGKPERP